MSFADLGVSKDVVRALAKRGIAQPFPVQQLVIRDALAGHDLLVQSPTGSGKTLAFGIPLIERLKPGKQDLGALVLAPTRELAGQIVDELGPIARARGLRVAAVYGGAGFGPQIKAVKSADVVVATPGRLEDLIARGAIDLRRICVLVLDEADRMLDMGFKPAVDRVVAHTPEQRQTLFFSATLEGATGKLATAYTRDARAHTHTPPQDHKAEIEHRFVHVDSPAAKIDRLAGELRGPDGGRTLVFVRTKRGADRLVKRLRSRELKAVAMHGDKSQGQRERALARFERGEVEILVATDVAARGIDVAEIAHVINFDAPGDRDTYVHRVGRTGRAGARGTGTSFILTEQAAEMRLIAQDLGLVAEFEQELGHLVPTKAAPQQRKAHSSQGNKPRSPQSGKPRSRRRRRNRRPKVSA